MTEEEFVHLSTKNKWEAIRSMMDYIQRLEATYNKRRHLHSDRDKREEQQRVRYTQYEEWSRVKDMYATHRDEMSNTLEEKQYLECKNILERVFAQELDDVLRNIIE